MKKLMGMSNFLTGVLVGAIAGGLVVGMIHTNVARDQMIVGVAQQVELATALQVEDLEVILESIEGKFPEIAVRLSKWTGETEVDWVLREIKNYYDLTGRPMPMEIAVVLSGVDSSTL